MCPKFWRNERLKRRAAFIRINDLDHRGMTLERGTTSPPTHLVVNVKNSTVAAQCCPTRSFKTIVFDLGRTKNIASALCRWRLHDNTSQGSKEIDDRALAHLVCSICLLLDLDNEMVLFVAQALLKICILLQRTESEIDQFQEHECVLNSGMMS